jgi:hypothetical protein
VRYLILENLEISGSTQNGINCDDGGDYANPDTTRHVIFRNLYIHEIGTGKNQDALKLSGVDDFFVLDCEFARTSAGGSGIDHVGCHAGVIAGCTFRQMGSNAIQCKGGSADILIRANQFIDGGMRAINIGGSTDFRFFRPPLATNAPNFEASNIRVIANVFRGSDAPVAFVGAIDSLVANNTIISPRRWVIRILQETTSAGPYSFLPCGRNAFVNNLLYYQRGQLVSHVNVGPHTDLDSFQFANNLWYAADQPGRSQPALPVAETMSLVGVDPKLADHTRHDYSIAHDSPAATGGKHLPGIAADFLGTPYNNPPSIGAFQARP